MNETIFKCEQKNKGTFLHVNGIKTSGTSSLVSFQPFCNVSARGSLCVISGWYSTKSSPILGIDQEAEKCFLVCTCTHTLSLLLIESWKQKAHDSEQRVCHVHCECMSVTQKKTIHQVCLQRNNILQY